MQKYWSINDAPFEDVITCIHEDNINQNEMRKVRGCVWFGRSNNVLRNYIRAQRILYFRLLTALEKQHVT